MTALEPMCSFLSAASLSAASLDPEFVWTAALLAALAYSLRSARLLGLDRRVMYWAGVCAILGGLWGGHLLGLVVHGSDGEPLGWLRFWAGAKSYYGGLCGGALAGAVFLRLRRLSVVPYADAVVPAVALGYAIGRIGCFLNGDDYGTLSHLPWAVQYPEGTEAHAAHVARGLTDPAALWSLPIHPVQLYASLLGVSLFVFLARWRPSCVGSRFCAFAVMYGVARFAMEGLRGDFRAVLGPLSLPQVFSLVLGFVGIAVWVGLPRKRHSQQNLPLEVA